MTNQLIQKPNKKKLTPSTPEVRFHPTDISVVVSMETKLSNELTDCHFDKGIRAFQNVKSEMDHLKIIVDGANPTTLIDVGKTYKVATDIYSKCLNFLSLSLQIYGQLEGTDYDSLKAENQELKAKVSEHFDNPIIYKTLVQAVDKNDKIISLFKKNSDRIDELFAQISLCKDSIMEIRLTLPELLNHESKDDLDRALVESKDRIEFGQRLLEEYKAQGL